MTFSAVEIASKLEMPTPTDEQVAVIEAPMNPLLVIAGAGSGKTETMSARVVYLVANDMVSVDKVLGLTFTKKAAAELSERVRMRLKKLRGKGVTLPNDDLGLARPTISTYHSYAASLVRDHALTLGIEPSSALLTQAAQWGLASEVLENWDGELNTDSALSTLTQAIIALSSQCDENLVEPDELARRIDEFVERLASIPKEPRATRENPFEREKVRPAMESLQVRSNLAELVSAYRRRKREREVIDFADQVALAARLVQSDPDVVAHERERFATVLLDEYQDTSHSQLVLLRELFGGGHSVTAVGDPNQAIYGWRGASAGGLARFPRDFTLEDGTPASVLTLSTSWRNDQAILNAANVLAEPLRNDRRIPMPELDARPDVQEGAVLAVMVEDTEVEARTIADFIEQRRKSQNEGVLSSAVLCRTRSQFRAISAALRERGLPVVIADLGGLLDSPEITDIVSTLKVVHDPSQGAALVRLLTGPYWNIGIADLHALNAVARELTPRRDRDDDDENVGVLEPIDDSSLIDALDSIADGRIAKNRGRSISQEGIKRLARASQMFRELRTQTYLPLPELVRRVEIALDLDIEVLARGGEEGKLMQRRMDAFRDIAASFSGTGQAEDYVTLGSFLSWLDSASEHEDGLSSPIPDLDPEAVQIMTVHGAKGLEWDIVAIPGFVEGTIPSINTKTVDGYAVPSESDSAWTIGLSTIPYPLRGDYEDLPQWDTTECEDQKDVLNSLKEFREKADAHQVKEERRLAYVAMTRARHSLLMTGSWWKGTNKSIQVQSRFLDELVAAGKINIDTWAGQPEKGETNPATEEVEEAQWPIDPLGDRRVTVETAAADISERLAAGETEINAGISPIADRWKEEVELLLEERKQVQSAETIIEIDPRLSASIIVWLSEDPDGYVRAQRRPMPKEPTERTQRGTAFHAWVEDRYRIASALVDEEADEDELLAPEDDPILDDKVKENFENSRWAAIKPIEIEADIRLVIDDVTIICRIDAIFEAPEGSGKSIEIVDWKTGQVPTGKKAQSRELQLAAYALAWSRAKNVPLSEIAAVFYYVDQDLTVPVAIPEDEEELQQRIRETFPTGELQS